MDEQVLDPTLSCGAVARAAVRAAKVSSCRAPLFLHAPQFPALLHCLRFSCGPSLSPVPPSVRVLYVRV